MNKMLVLGAWIVQVQVRVKELNMLSAFVSQFLPGAS